MRSPRARFCCHAGPRRLYIYIVRVDPFGSAVDDRLIGKTLRGENRSTELDTAPSFIEGLSSVSTVVATVRVSQPNYVPAALNLRTRVATMLFTASMSQQGLMTILHDSRVEVVQPSQIIHPDAKR